MVPGSLAEQSNVTDQSLDITLTEYAAPGWHKPPFAIKDAVNQFFIIETVGHVGVGVVHWINSHELSHDAIAIPFFTVTDLAICLIELHTQLRAPHQIMLRSAQKA